MSYRRKLKKSVSRRVFRKTSGIHKKNFKAPISRGGIRL